ncbi:MAG: flagellar protein FlgN [Bdellovibrionales bacterium]
MRELQQVTKLQDILAEQNKIYSSLCHLLQSENDYLIQSDIENINKAASLKESLMIEAEKKEGERLQLCSVLADRLRIFSEQPKLLEIAIKLPEPHKRKLIEHKKGLEGLFADIKTLSSENQVLAGRALNTIGGTLGAMKEGLTGSKTYEKKGKVDQNKGQLKHLLNKSV